jgi:hypothetical protein
MGEADDMMRRILRGGGMTDTAAIFERDRYAVLFSLLKEPSLSQTYHYACTMADRGLMGTDEQVPGTPSSYGDFMMDGLLTDLLPHVQSASGLALSPTYSYFRVYKHGDSLAKHVDRASCEVSVTLCLGREGEEAWPILIEGPRGVSSISLAPGDAMLYRGMECPHWREMFEGRRQAQLFLHYVDKNGSHADLKFDERASTDLIAPSNLQHKRT